MRTWILAVLSLTSAAAPARPAAPRSSEAALPRLMAGSAGFEASASAVLGAAREARQGLLQPASHKEGFLQRFNGAVAHLVSETSPSVVRVGIPLPDGSCCRGSGTGFIVDASGLVVTNDHVAGPAGIGGKVLVQLSGGRQAEGTVVARHDRKDIALVQLPKGGRWPVLPLGRSASVAPGHMVLALGFPMGLPLTATLGVVSGLDREAGNPFFQPIQTDAAINPGNSGGPLLAMDGSVVGVNTFIMSGKGGGSVGLGFAVPVETVRGLLAKYRRSGNTDYGWLGVGFALDASRGAVVGTVTAGSPAEGKLQVGDRVLQLQGKALPASPEAVVAILRSLADSTPGSEVDFLVERGGERVGVRVTLGRAEQKAPQGEPDGEAPGAPGVPGEPGGPGSPEGGPEAPKSGPGGDPLER